MSNKPHSVSPERAKEQKALADFFRDSRLFKVATTVNSVAFSFRKNNKDTRAALEILANDGFLVRVGTDAYQNAPEPLAPDYEALARAAGAKAKAASEARQKAALAFQAADEAAQVAHKELVDLVGTARAGFYISR